MEGVIKLAKRMIIIIILCSVVVLIAFVIKVLYFPVIYPTRSSSRELTLVLHGGFHPNSPIITLSHYIDELHIANYTLTIENGIHIQEPQSYELPILEEGAVKVNIELRDEINSNFTVVYNQARDLYRSGLLIYLYTDFNNYFIEEGKYFFDRYVHFISGRNRTIYFLSGENRINYLQNGICPEWLVVMSSPQLRRVPRNDVPYLIWYSGWGENNWIKTYGVNFNE